MSDEIQPHRDSSVPYALPLMVGGPLHRLLVRLRLSGPSLEFLPRRILVVLAITWLPLLVLAIVEGHAWGGVGVSFLKDVGAQVRLLESLPLLIAAEAFLHRRMREGIPLFVERGLVDDAQRAQFADAVASVRRWLSWSAVEWGLLAAVYAVALAGAMPKETQLAADSWHGTFGNGEVLTLAGWWAAMVSLPLFQFLFARVYFRILVWWRFLWLVSRIDLNLQPLHADKMGGLRFLSRLSGAFVPLFLAQGAVVSGVIADHIFYSGAALTDYQEEIAALCVLLTALVLAPLLTFRSAMSRARHAALLEYETLSTRYARSFDQKWFGPAPDEPLLGSPDVQSLADLGNSYDAVSRMHTLPIDRATLIKLLCAVLLPLVPLLLTMFSLKDLLLRVVEIMF